MAVEPSPRWGSYPTRLPLGLGLCLDAAVGLSARSKAPPWTGGDTSASTATTGRVALSKAAKRRGAASQAKREAERTAGSEAAKRGRAAASELGQQGRRGTCSVSHLGARASLPFVTGTEGLALACAAGVAAAARHATAIEEGGLMEVEAALVEMLFWWRTVDSGLTEPESQSLVTSAGLEQMRPGLIWARNTATHQTLAVSKHVGGLQYPMRYPLDYRERFVWRSTDEVPPPDRGPQEWRAQQETSYRQVLDGDVTTKAVETMSCFLALVLREAKSLSQTGLARASADGERRTPGGR